MSHVCTLLINQSDQSGCSPKTSVIFHCDKGGGGREHSELGGQRCMWGLDGETMGPNWMHTSCVLFTVQSKERPLAHGAAP